MADERILPAWMLSVSPPLFLTGMAHDDYLGLARAFGRRFGNIDAGFIVFPVWTLEREGIPAIIRTQYLEHAAEYPRHCVRFICNSPKESQLLQAQGLPATLVNHNVTISETTFHPSPDVPVEFDAVYNTRFIPEKRLHLCALVPSVAYLTYVQKLAGRQAQFEEVYRRVVDGKPNHVLLNSLENGVPVSLGYDQINLQLARASVGLALSAVEGANYASMEYLLAGLPVVSTPSLGGRDVYFDPDYCIICDPTPAAVRDAVAALKARNIPREEVRARTIAKVAGDRSRFLALADEVLSELGAPSQFGGKDWPFRHWSSVRWHPYSYYMEQYEAAGGLGEDEMSE